MRVFKCPVVGQREQRGHRIGERIGRIKARAVHRVQRDGAVGHAQLGDRDLDHTRQVLVARQEHQIRAADQPQLHQQVVQRARVTVPGVGVQRAAQAGQAAWAAARAAAQAAAPARQQHCRRDDERRVRQCRVGVRFDPGQQFGRLVGAHDARPAGVSGGMAGVALGAGVGHEKRDAAVPPAVPQVVQQHAFAQVALVTLVGLAAGLQQPVQSFSGAGSGGRCHRLPVVVDLVVVEHRQADQAAQHRLRTDTAIAILVGHPQPVLGIADAAAQRRQAAGPGVEQAGGGVGIDLVAGQHQQAGALAVVGAIEPRRQPQHRGIGRAGRHGCGLAIGLRRAVDQAGRVLAAGQCEAERQGDRLQHGFGHAGRQLGCRDGGNWGNGGNGE